MSYLLLGSRCGETAIDRKEFMQFMGELLDLVKAKHQKNLHRDLDQASPKLEKRIVDRASSFDLLVDRSITGSTSRDAAVA